MLDAKERENFLSVIGHLYDAATDVSKWPVFLEKLSHYLQAPYTNFFHFDPAEPKFSFVFTTGHTPPKEVVDGFREIFPRDKRAIMNNRYPGKPISCRSHMTDEEWHQSEAYQLMCKFTHFLPAVEYTLSATLPEEDGTTTALALMRFNDGQAFSQDECDRLGEFMPHIHRAISIQKRLTLADLSRRTALEALDHIPTGIVVTDADAKIQHVNATAKDILARKDGLSLSGGTLRLNVLNESAEFGLAVRRAVEAAQSGDIPPGQAMTVTRTTGDEGYPLMISTLWGNHTKLGLGVLDRPLAVVFITDPDRPQEAPSELLQWLYGLTPSEARLLERLVAGQPLKDAAGDVNLSVNTARQYLKQIFQKTDTNRQSELVRKVMTSPIWMQAKRLTALPIGLV